jgi:acyl carrier protein
VLAHLHYLNQLRINSNKNAGQKAISSDNFSIDSLIRKHNVTHMQCTPSMAKMLTIDESSTEALSKLKTMLIGGEAFPVNLAKKLLQTVSGDLFNMYGPTETTIWSTIHKLSEPVGNSISIGKPIANTQIFMLDKNYQLVPAGIAGELCIGGDGVTDGYYNRPELTDDRFISNPFSENGEQKIYRTGDLAYFSNDGTIEFLGRLDHQVKIRGYRIELGDIESQLSAHPDVKEAIVLAREDTPGDQRLVAYLIPANGAINNDSLKEFLKGKIPEYMVPAHYVSLSAYPLTPNGKIDRKAFPIPTNGESEENKKDFVLPTGELEVKIADIWQNLLNVNKVGTKDNFFDIGGHSLLAVQLHSKLKNTVDESLTLIDIFRYPTITSLIKYLNSRNDLTEETTALPVSKRALMSKQRKGRLKSHGKNNSDDIEIQEIE